LQSVYEEVAAVLRLVDVQLLDHVVKLGASGMWSSTVPQNMLTASLEIIVPFPLIRRLFAGLLPYETYWFFAETCLFTAHDFPNAVSFLIACCLKCVRTDILRSAKVSQRLQEVYPDMFPAGVLTVWAVGSRNVGVQGWMRVPATNCPASFVSPRNRR
jgi:hypothetical protein